MEIKHEIAIIGPKELILGFKAIGVETRFSSNVSDTIDQINQLKKENIGELPRYAIIFILESHAKEIPQDKYKKLTEDALPALIALPGPEGSTGFSMDRLGQIVEKAIGSNILKD